MDGKFDKLPSLLPSILFLSYSLGFFFFFLNPFHPVLVEALGIIEDDDIFPGGLSSCCKTLPGTHHIFSLPLPLPRSSFPVAFILFQPLAIKTVRTTCWLCHTDQILNFAHTPAYLCLSFFHLPPLHLYFCFNPQRFTSNLLKAKKLKWRITDAHIETLYLRDSAILKQAWV